MSSASSTSPQDIRALIDDYYRQKPSFTEHIHSPDAPSSEEKAEPPKPEAKASSDKPQERAKKSVAQLKREFYYGNLNSIEVLRTKREDARLEKLRKEKEVQTQTVDMPVLPKEEEAHAQVGGSTYTLSLHQLHSVRRGEESVLTDGHIVTDQVAKESSDSNASDHPIHDEAAAVRAHGANPVR